MREATDELAKEYWLITVHHPIHNEFWTIAIDKHPSKYIATNIYESLIFAIPVSKEQFDEVKKRRSE